MNIQYQNYLPKLDSIILKHDFLFFKNTFLQIKMPVKPAGFRRRFCRLPVWWFQNDAGFAGCRLKKKPASVPCYLLLEPSVSKFFQLLFNTKTWTPAGKNARGRGASFLYFSARGRGRSASYIPNIARGRGQPARG